MRPGSLSTQFNDCGSPVCAAARPTGPASTLQVSYTRMGKSNTRFVTKEDLPEVRQQLKHDERMNLLMEKWIDLGRALSILRLAKKPPE